MWNGKGYSGIAMIKDVERRIREYRRKKERREILAMLIVIGIIFFILFLPDLLLWVF